MNFIWGMVAGWTGGAFGMWLYFSRSGLIRSREEYYAHQARQGREWTK